MSLFPIFIRIASVGLLSSATTIGAPAASPKVIQDARAKVALALVGSTSMEDVELAALREDERATRESTKGSIVEPLVDYAITSQKGWRDLAKGFYKWETITRYGNWYGPGWWGGGEDKDQPGSAQPVDELDAVAQRHDFAYQVAERMGKIHGTREQYRLMAIADWMAVRDSMALDEDPAKWDPPPSDISAADRYRNRIITGFDYLSKGRDLQSAGSRVFEIPSWVSSPVTTWMYQEESDPSRLMGMEQLETQVNSLVRNWQRNNPRPDPGDSQPKGKLVFQMPGIEYRLVQEENGPRLVGFYTTADGKRVDYRSRIIAEGLTIPMSGNEVPFGYLVYSPKSQTGYHIYKVIVRTDGTEQGIPQWNEWMRKKEAETERAAAAKDVAAVNAAMDALIPHTFVVITKLKNDPPEVIHQIPAASLQAPVPSADFATWTVRYHERPNRRGPTGDMKEIALE